MAEGLPPRAIIERSQVTAEGKRLIDQPCELRIHPVPISGKSREIGKFFRERRSTASRF